MDVLVVSVGMTPQVVTETVWALFRRDPPFVPAEIHLLTTRLGELRLRGRPLPGGHPLAGGELPSLCDPDEEGNVAHDDPGRLPALYRQFGRSLPRVLVHVSAERPPDLQGEAVNLDFADLCARVLARIHNRHPGARLHVSLVGGRKSQSFYLGYALSLLGRSGDELSHVLVPAERENDPGFWWPADGEQSVALVGVPFVPLRDYVDPALVDRLSDDRAGFGELVAAVQAAAAPDLALELEASSRRVRVGGIELILQPVRFALLWLLAAVRRGDVVDPLAPPGRLVWWSVMRHPTLLRAFLGIFERCGGSFDQAQVLQALCRRLREHQSAGGKDSPIATRPKDPQTRKLQRALEQVRAKLADDLEHALPPPLRARVQIRWRRERIVTPEGIRRFSVFGLEGVDPGRIVLRG